MLIPTPGAKPSAEPSGYKSASDKPSTEETATEKPADPQANPDTSSAPAAPAAPAEAPTAPAPALTPMPSQSTPPASVAPTQPATPVQPSTPSQPAAPPAPTGSPAAPPTPSPATETKPQEAAATAAAVPPPRPTKHIEPGQAHVLVVEDNVPNFVLIARMLAYMGVQRCEWKTSGWQVVEFADTLPRIDLILMDIRLPYEDGFQALEKVRANSRLKETLVVAVTAEASAEQMKRAQNAGFDGFLSKPLDPDRFPDQIRRVLNGEAVWELH